jgi:hypothetical protein
VSETEHTDAPVGPSNLRLFLRRLAKGCAYLVLFLAVAIGFWMSGAVYDHYVRFPREEVGWQELRAQRRGFPEMGPWTEYRGILHAHSKFSHDSAVPMEEILRVLQSTRINFICLSDHCIDGRADFDWQWHGLHESKLFIPGFEMRDGFMPFGDKPGTVLSNSTDSATLARQIVANGGVLFYAHPEEPRDWDRPELTGMEIYNIHSDFKRFRRGLLGLLPEVLLNQRRFPDQVSRLIFQRPSDFLQHWDQLNATRHLTGIAGNDCHHNTGLRLTYLPSDQLQIDDTSPKVPRQIKLNWLTRLVARALFGPLEPNRVLFQLQLDPYERMARFVNTHVLASDMSQPAILDALRAGRVFVGFDMIADSSGFRWWTGGITNQVVMGETAEFSKGTVLHARSSIPCRFTVVQDGRAAHRAEGRELNWPPPGPGKYRVEAELQVCNDWVPWVYANPIQLR